MRVIKSTIGLIKRKKFIKKQTKLVSDYISSGKYIYDNNCSYIVLNDNKEILNASELFSDKIEGSKNRLIQFIKNILSFGTLKVEGNSKKYNATIILLTYKNKSFKMFDFKKNLVITKYFEKTEYFKTITNYEHFKNYFNIPKLIETNNDEYVIIEEFIKYTPTSRLNNDEKKDLIRDIFNRYILYIKHNTENIVVKEGYAYIKSLGDMIYKNILYKEKEFYYIDFELSSENFILYDIFTFIFYSYNNNNENNYYKEYIKGSYDHYIKEMFNLSGINYDINRKEEYFKVFIKERAKLDDNIPLIENEAVYIEAYNKLKESI